jgi:hypothetical protein
MKHNSTDTKPSEAQSTKPGIQVKHTAGSDFPGKPGLSVPLEIKDEIGGPSGLEPTRFGDWEVNGRCSDF